MIKIISNNDILEFLLNNKDEKYRNFSSSLIPESHELIGVRLPLLRNLAKQIAKENNVYEYLKNASSKYFEEIMLQGLVIGYYNADIQTIINLCSKFVPKIDNWSICDSFCNSLKISKKYPTEIYNYITNYINSDKPYELRFLIVMLLNHYIDKNYLYDIFDIIGRIKKENYYVKMAIAWLISVCYIHFPKETLNYLTTCTLDKFTYNKGLQKIIESYRVSNESKKIIRNMKK